MGDVGVGTNVQPYVQIQFNGVLVKNKHVEGGDKEKWVNNEFLIPVVCPTMSSTIVVSIWDHDIGSDERIGTFTLNYEEIAENRNAFKGRWYNIYGAPKHKQKGIADKMNCGYVEGTYFRGRVLLAASVDRRMAEREEKEKKKKKS